VAVTVLYVPNEATGGERRVSVVPVEIAGLEPLGIRVTVEQGAGERAGFPDEAYVDAGARLVPGSEPASSGADVVAMVGPPSLDRAEGLPEGSALISFLPSSGVEALIERLRDRRITAFSFNLVPRTSRAQSVDALSSQAGMAGYQAVIRAATRSPRVLPLMMTAAGTVPPARVLVLGAGVAGLQAIATARRLGASVSAYDIRPEAAEEIRSLGAQAIELPLVPVEGDGSYAAEQSDGFAGRQQELMAGAVAAADVVITTAAVPGRPAPRLITAAMVDSMRPGSVIVDLAAPSGGNCELTEEGSEVQRSGVAVIGVGDLASEVPASASALYARNVTNLLKLLVRDGELKPDFDDDIVAATCVTRGGELRIGSSGLMSGGGSR
jgi:H+-translocating NAD(P) transhydrogenase subunit alpha